MGTVPYIVWLLQNAGASPRVATCITDRVKPHILWAQFHILCGFYKMLDQVPVWPHVSRIEGSLTYYGHSSIYCQVTTECWNKSSCDHMYHGQSQASDTLGTVPYIVWLLRNAEASPRVATCITDRGKPHILWAQFHDLCGYYRILDQVLLWPHTFLMRGQPHVLMATVP